MDFNKKKVQELIDEEIIFPPMDGNHGEKHPKTSDYVDDGIPFILVPDLVDGLVDLEHCNHISKAQADTLSKGISITGDVLFTHKATIGKVAIVDTRDNEYIILTPQVTYYRVKNPDVLDNRYLYYYFKSNYFQHIFKLYASSGGTRDYLGIVAQRKLPIIFPDISVQKYIVSILVPYDDLIANNNKRIKILEQMAENLYKEWFVRFRFPGYETAEFLDGVPKGWDVYRLDEICDINKHSLNKSDKIDKIQYLDTGSLTENSITNLEDYYRSDAPSRAKRKVQENSILFSTVRPALKHYGILKKVPENMIVSTGFAVLDSKYDIANIIYMHLSSEVVLSYCQMIAEGAVATYPTIKPEEIGEIKIVLPPIETAVVWNEKLEAYFSMQLKLVEQNQNLIKQRDYLLPRLMSGKLQVK